MKLIVLCDCGNIIVVEENEYVLCTKCGRKAQFRYTDVGAYRFEGVKW